MNDSDIYAKTAAGTEELKSRSHGLAPRLRTMLIMVDGNRTAAQLTAAAVGLGAPPDFLDQLQRLRLVELLPAPSLPPVAEFFERREADAVQAPQTEMPGTQADRYMAARKLMNTTAVDALGLRAFLFTLKLERCTTAVDLALLLPEFTQSLTKARGDLFARRVADQVRALLD